MNIILLSGGSGKRLWPLSNGSRSKQFLKLLKDENGQYESMVQRVYRQIKCAEIDAHIVVATGESQVDSIRCQLGKQVDIVIEPERRDTFPAIALASVYLFMKKQMKEDEVVLALPVDPYADLEYFRIMKHMELAIKSGAGDIALMGISPTYPSEKYGYIVPCEKRLLKDDIWMYSVERFQEKPSLEKAGVLLEQGAKWNGGVFAFKLGFLLDIVRSYIPVLSYENFRDQYSLLKKNSFDYEVVEKTSSIVMISYDGKWKDLGTWNTLSEELAEEAMGHVLLGEGTERTTVINETGRPVVVLGAKDMVVAASPDGILVSDKHCSSYLKPYVEKIDERPMYKELIWGDYKITDYVQYDDGTCSLAKHMFIQSGRYISYQSHSKRSNIWVIVDGDGEAVVEGKKKDVKQGDVIYIKTGQKHALRALSNIHMIEVQIGNSLEEEDINEYEWKW